MFGLSWSGPCDILKHLITDTLPDSHAPDLHTLCRGPAYRPPLGAALCSGHLQVRRTGVVSLPAFRKPPACRRNTTDVKVSNLPGEASEHQDHLEALIQIIMEAQDSTGMRSTRYGSQKGPLHPLQPSPDYHGCAERQFEIIIDWRIYRPPHRAGLAQRFRIVARKAREEGAGLPAPEPGFVAADAGVAQDETLKPLQMMRI